LFELIAGSGTAGRDSGTGDGEPESQSGERADAGVRPAEAVLLDDPHLGGPFACDTCRHGVGEVRG